MARDLDVRTLDRRLVVATAVRVLDRTLMRVGNDEYARHNQSYGLTTLLDEAGEAHRIGSEDINDYVRESTGGDFTAKDFRTWAATVLAVVELSKLEPVASEAAKKKNIVEAIKQVAARLGNTPAVCRSSYVHPEVLASYLDGSLPVERILLDDTDNRNSVGLTIAEPAVLRFLRRRMKEREVSESEPRPSLAEALTLSVEAT